MQKYDMKIVNTFLCLLTIIFALLGVFYSNWFMLGIFVFLVVSFYFANRSKVIEHYSIAVDLDSNVHGDVLEFYLCAFSSEKGGYYRPISFHRKQMNIFVDVVLLENFYNEAGYEVIEDTTYHIRKVNGFNFDNISQAKLAYKVMLKDLNSVIEMSAGSLKAVNLDQPVKQIKKSGITNKLWRLWSPLT